MSTSTTRRGFVSGLAMAGIGAAAATAASTGTLKTMVAKAAETEVPETWDYEYDIVVCGAGGAGLIAALRAHDEGASVIVIDANFEMGGHAALSHGLTHSGGGNSWQEKWGIEDTPEQVYLDHTNPVPMDSRFNDRAIVREYANRSVECFEWMLSKGMKMVDTEPTMYKTYLEEGGTDCETVARKAPADAGGYVNLTNGKTCESGDLNGISVTRPFEETALAEGVDFMYDRHMDALIQDEDGRVVGVRASHTPRFLKDGTQLKGLHYDESIQDEADELTFHATKAVIVCTGGGMSNVEYRTMFDPRWTQEYDGVAGEPFSYADASGEIAGLSIGAGLGATANWTVQCKWPFAAAIGAGCRYGYKNLRWDEGSPVWEFAGAKGLYLYNFDGAIQVNMLGKRFYNEEAQNGFYSDGDGMWDYFAACFGSVILDEGTPEARRVGGPLWTIFDADYAASEGFNCAYPDVDTENGYFFSGDTIEELAQNIVNKYYEDYPMDPQVLVDTISHYNEMVDKGHDEDFGKPDDEMTKKIETGPFYAAWSTPVPHDTLTGLRTNAHRQVLTVMGEPIPGLYAAGECAGGMHTHGLGKVQTAGYIAGLYAATEN